jgi:phenylalanyl-tRNA synthetase beta chain
MVAEVHPTVRREWRLPPAAVLVAQLPEDPPPRAPRRVRRPSRYPAVRRDLSVLVPATVPYAELARTVRAAAGERLADLSPFDRYRTPAGDSLTMMLLFQADDRTLTEEEVDAAMAAVVSALDGLGVRLRVE